MQIQHWVWAARGSFHSKVVHHGGVKVDESYTGSDQTVFVQGWEQPEVTAACFTKHGMFSRVG